MAAGTARKKCRQGAEAHSTDAVVTEIDRRLQQIADRESKDRLDYLDSLAARIGLRRRGVEPKEDAWKNWQLSWAFLPRIPGLRRELVMRIVKLD
jgi:hypothetical protein